MLAAAVLLQNHHAQALEKRAKGKAIGAGWSWGKKLLGLGDDAARAAANGMDDVSRAERAAARSTRPGPMRGYGGDTVSRAEAAATRSTSPGPFGGNAPTPRATPTPTPAATPSATTSAAPSAASSNAASPLTPEAIDNMTGKGGKYWGAKPSVEQLNNGNRPFSLQSFNPLRDRVYANDKSVARRLTQATLGTVGVAGVGGTVDNVVNTPKRMERAGEYGAAQAMAELQKGTTWEKLLRVLGLTFGSDNAILEQLNKVRPGVAKAFKYMKDTGYQPKQDSYEDFKKLYLGQ